IIQGNNDLRFDITNSGSITSMDALEVLRYHSGLSTTAPTNRIRNMHNLWISEMDNPLVNKINSAVSKYGDEMYGDLNMGGNRITNVAYPETNNDVATKEYVDSIAGGEGIISTIRSINGNTLPNAPLGVSEWPSFLLCDNSQNNHILLPFQFVGGTNQRIAYRIPASSSSNDLMYIFNSDGSYHSRQQLSANCGSNSLGSDLVSICNAGYCIFD
ncbi:MAG: hypothetical protein LAT82_02650, partial [Nanoarchaeota archaeon]|nr:hypothetical protein [Nanoarchaeota archaeon]